MMSIAKLIVAVQVFAAATEGKYITGPAVAGKYYQCDSAVELGRGCVQAPAAGEATVVLTDAGKCTVGPCDTSVDVDGEGKCTGGKECKPPAAPAAPKAGEEDGAKKKTTADEGDAEKKVKANVCTCTGGTAATGAACTADKKNICDKDADCNAGYHKDKSGTQCQANVCTCTNGKAATGKDCTVNKENTCASCNTGSHLKTAVCQATKTEIKGCTGGCKKGATVFQAAALDGFKAGDKITISQEGKSTQALTVKTVTPTISRRLAEGAGSITVEAPGLTADLACTDAEPCNMLVTPAAEADVGSTCFPGEAMVNIDGAGESQIHGLRIGDRVRSAVGYETVLGFLHQAQGIKSSFSTIAHSYGEFRATENHLVFTTDGSKAVGDVQVGEQILISPSGPASKVLEVRKGMTNLGMFSPLTASGTVFVDGMVASIYGQPSMGRKLTHSSAHAAFFPVRAYHALGLPRVFGNSQKEDVHPFAQLLLPLQMLLSK